MIASKFIQIQTAATGTNFTTLPDLPARVVNVINATGTSLSFVHTNDDDEIEFVLPDGMAFAFDGINNANQLKVKRTDESNTQVTLNAMEVVL